jgi:hypothetical protein
MDISNTTIQKAIQIIDYGIATDEEIELVTSLNGYTEETLDDIVYVRTDCQDLEEFKDHLKEKK